MKKILSVLILIGILSSCQSKKENPVQIKSYSELNYNLLSGIDPKEPNPGVAQYHYELYNLGKVKLIVTLIQPNKKTKRLYETIITEGNLSVIAFFDDLFVAVHKNNDILDSFQFKKDPNYQLENQVIQKLDFIGTNDSVLSLPNKKSFAVAAAVFDATSKQYETSSFVILSDQKIDWKSRQKQLSKDGVMILVELQVTK